MDSKALTKLGYGLYVVGSRRGEKLNAQIANAVFQVTSEPPALALSINKKNLTHEYIMESKVVAVSVLCEATPLPFIGRFGFKSGRDTNKLDGVSYRIGETGAPVVIENATAFLEAKVTKSTDVGTHTIFIAEVVAGEVLSEETCMTYDFYRKVKGGTAPKTAPVSHG